MTSLKGTLMTETLLVYRITDRTLSSLKTRFSSAFDEEKTQEYYGLFLVETPNPKIQLIMHEEALVKNFDLEEAPEDTFFSATTRTLAEYLNR